MGTTRCCCQGATLNLGGFLSPNGIMMVYKLATVSYYYSITEVDFGVIREKEKSGLKVEEATPMWYEVHLPMKRGM